MKTVKRIAALFALMFTAAAWAVDAPTPVALWNGDFKETEKGAYTLSANGNTVAADGSTITIAVGSTKGVKITLPTNAQEGSVIVKYSNLTPTASDTWALMTMGGGNNTQDSNVDIMGACCVGVSRSASGVWDRKRWTNKDSGAGNYSESGTMAYVYKYNDVARGYANGTLIYTADKNLQGSAVYLKHFGIGGKQSGLAPANGTDVTPAIGMKVEAIAVFGGKLTDAEIAAYEFPQKESSSTPVLLINIGTTTAVDGWLAHNQTEGEWIPTKTTKLSQGDATFQVSKSTFGGNFSSAEGFGSPVTTTFESGSYRDVFGNDHDSIFEEIKTSLGLAADISESVYTTGVINGGQNSHIGTIGGLDASAKYIVYVGQGYKKKDGNDTHSFKIDTDGYATVEGLDYAVTVNGTGTAKNAQYTSFDAGTTLQPGVNGLLIVRMKGIVPKEDGTIAFSMPAGRSGLNFLAVAKVNEAVKYTTAELSYEGDVELSAINAEITEQNNKAEVTLTSGATVYVNEAPVVITKLICEGSITLSSNSKPELSKFDLSGVAGGIVRTWLTDDEKTKGIGFNFAKGCGPNTAQALAETVWYDNAKENNGSNKAFSSDGLTTITYTSKNTYNDSGNNNDDSNGTLVKGYLDDGNGDGVQITVKNVPFAEYAVIIYASTDQGGKTLSFKKVNGENYTYDSAHSDVAKVGQDAWGACQSSSSVSYGRNAIRVIAQTAGTLTIESKRDDSKNVRGCISAIQIVPYSSFVAPVATIGSVESKCSENYTENTITGVLSDCDLHSWTGDLIARVVINSTVYESAAIADNKFTIQVSELKRETVYRTVLEVGYKDGEVFTAIATQPVALYQGERQYTWMASPIVIKKATTINSGEGCTAPVPTDMPDYVENCDSVFTVSISAAEAVSEENDTESLEGVQGGVRIAEVGGALKLQVVKNGVWTVFSNAEIDKTYAMTVTFHYAKDENDTDPAVSYVLDKTTETSAKMTDKTKVTEVFIADGTVLPDDLTGLFQFDSAVVVDIELKPGEGDLVEYSSKEAAEAALGNLKIGICDAVKSVLKTEEQQSTYRSYFYLAVVPSAIAKDGFAVKTELKSDITTEIEKDIAEAMAKVVEGFNTGSAEIAAKPGLYYGVKRGDSLDAMNTVETEMATSEKVTITITKPDNAKQHFYRIIVSPTPASNK